MQRGFLADPGTSVVDVVHSREVHPAEVQGLGLVYPTLELLLSQEISMHVAVCACCGRLLKVTFLLFIRY